MSATGEYLATAHADGLGINLWSNRSLFVPISTQNVDETDIADVGVPTISGENGVGAIEAAFSEDDLSSDAEGPVLSTEQLSRDMVTLSVVPKSKWQTLLHLDLVKVLCLSPICFSCIGGCL
jgi:U3 small nucleolar RNA-associated protein 21